MRWNVCLVPTAHVDSSESRFASTPSARALSGTPTRKSIQKSEMKADFISIIFPCNLSRIFKNWLKYSGVIISSNCNVVLNNGLIDDSNLTDYGGRHGFDCLASTLGASLAWNMCALKCPSAGRGGTRCGEILWCGYTYCETLEVRLKCQIYAGRYS